MRIRSSARSLVTASLLLLALAVLFTSPELTVIAALPLLPLLLPAAGSVRVDLSVPREVRVGEAFEVRLRVHATGFGLFKAMHSLPESFELVEGSNAVAKFVLGRSGIDITYRCVSRSRGIYDIGRVIVDVENPVSGSRITSEINIKKSVEVKAKVRRVRRFEATRGIASRAVQGIDVSKIGPPGTDFREVRRYVPGDPVKFVNWKATARLGELMVNEFEREGRKTFWLFVDANPYMVQRCVEGSALDVAVEIAASLCYYLVVRGYRVGLYVVGHGILLYPESGRRQFRRVFEVLTHVSISRSMESFERAVSAVKKYVESAKSAYVFITRLERSDVSSYGVPQIVFAISASGDGMSSEIAEALRRRKVSRLRGSGVQVYEVAGGDVERVLAGVVV